jgi:hypothetical protein
MIGVHMYNIARFLHRVAVPAAKLLHPSVESDAVRAAFAFAVPVRNPDASWVRSSLSVALVALR